MRNSLTVGLQGVGNASLLELRRLFGKVLFSLPPRMKAQQLTQYALREPWLSTIRLNGHAFECWSSEKYYWFREDFEAETRLTLESVLTPDSVLYDVGAHAGFWEVMLYRKCRHIYAFEPSPVNFGRLSRNAGDLPNVTLVNSACSDFEGHLYLTEGNSMSRISDSGTPVRCLRLDEFAAHNLPPTTLKIDIEGYGAKAVSGMSGLSHPPKLLIEIHNQEEAEAAGLFPELLAALPADIR